MKPPTLSITHLLSTTVACAQDPDSAGQGMVHDATPLQRARTMVRQDLAAGGNRAGELTNQPPKRYSNEDRNNENNNENHR
jgi:hypothetical protein